MVSSSGRLTPFGSLPCKQPNDRPGVARTARLLSLVLVLVPLLLAVQCFLSGSLSARPRQGEQSALPGLTPASQSTARLEADQQHKQGDVFFADGNVDITYGGYRLRGDHAQYNSTTFVATINGHVQFDFDTQHLTADSGEFNVRSGAGRFENVQGTVRATHRENVNVLVTPNPLSFHAREVRRLDMRTYVLDHVWLTVCEPQKPTWQFFTETATIHIDQKVALVNANFRILRVPLLYLPYASLPAGNKLRQSGFLIPEPADTSVKGLVLGDAYYWAPADWTDLTLGGAWLSKRGWQQNFEYRARPWQNIDFSMRYFGVIDRGYIAPDGELTKQGGHTANVSLNALLGHGWRAVADLNQLTSLTFQLAFAPTFGQAVNSEVRSSAFLTNSFHGFTFDLADDSYKNFLNAEPEVHVNLRTAPEIRLSSVDQAPWQNLPFYFGLDSSISGNHRDDPQINTADFVSKYEAAPRAVLPVHLGDWLGVTMTSTLRSVRYGSQLVDDEVAEQPFSMTTGEINIDLRPPSLERVWSSRGSRWKHTIEPLIVYDYVRGVNAFDHIIRFNEDDTLTDTNQFQYGVTQRLFRRRGDAPARELLTWTVKQDYYFDPTFNGALTPGTRNVFQALDSISAFAFADEPRRFSPVESDLLLTPGGIYDAEVRLEYDPVRDHLTTVGTLVKIQASHDFNFTVAQYSIDNSPDLQPVSNQVRAQIGYGALNRIGWNASMGFGYDIRQQYLQSQVAQIGYNGSCCGIALEYQRLALGQIREENEFRAAFVIANLGTFGNLRRAENVF